MGNSASTSITPVGSDDERDPSIKDDVRLVRMMRSHEQLANAVASYIIHHLVVYGEGELGCKDVDLIYRTTQELASDNEALFSEFLRDYNAGRRQNESPDAPNHRQVIRFIGELFKTAPEPVDHVTLRLRVLDTLCQVEKNRDYFIEAKMVPLILGTMAAHSQVSSVQQYGCQVLAELASYVPANTLKAPMREGGVELVAKAMNNHRHRLLVVRPATSVLANLAETVETLIQQALKPTGSNSNNPELVDKLAALLGLKENIKKTGLGLVNDARILFPKDVTIQIQAQRLTNLLDPELKSAGSVPRSNRSVSHATIQDVMGPAYTMRRFSDYSVIERRGSNPTNIHEITAPGRPKSDLYSTIDDLVGSTPRVDKNQQKMALPKSASNVNIANSSDYARIDDITGGGQEGRVRASSSPTRVPHIVISKDYATIDDIRPIADGSPSMATSPGNGYASIEDFQKGGKHSEGEQLPVAPPRRTRSLKIKEEPIYAKVVKKKRSSTFIVDNDDEVPAYAVIDRTDESSRKTSTVSDSIAYQPTRRTGNVPVYARVNKTGVKDNKSTTLQPGADRGRSGSLVNIMPFQTFNSATAALDKTFNTDRRKSTDSEIFYNPKYRPRGDASLLEASTLFTARNTRGDSISVENDSVFEDNLVYETASNGDTRSRADTLGSGGVPSISLTDVSGNSIEGEEIVEKVAESFVKKSRDRLLAMEQEMEAERRHNITRSGPSIGGGVGGVGVLGNDDDDDVYSTIDADLAQYHARTATGRPSIMLEEDVRLKPTRLAKLKQVAANIVHHNKHTSGVKVKVAKETTDNTKPNNDKHTSKGDKTNNKFLKKSLRRVASLSTSDEKEGKSHIDSDNPESSSFDISDERKGSVDSTNENGMGRYLKNKLNYKGKDHYGSSDTLSHMKNKKSKQKKHRTHSENFGSVESLDGVASDDSSASGVKSKKGAGKKRNVLKQLFKGKKIRVKKDDQGELPVEEDLFRSAVTKPIYSSTSEDEKEELPPPVFL